MSMVVTHIAGLDVTLDGRYMRQLCAWCGHELIDYDLALVAVALNPDGSHPGPPAAWQAGSFVQIDGGVSATLDVDRLPENFCGRAVFAEPSDA